ncbi:oxidoreductase-like protein [Xylariomycetidae sp. FL2044]|nr:oxidoreductase-like protein [Xylariomycetidae sp. FL2044]
MTTERSDLQSRILPQVALGDGTNLTAPPPPLPREPASRAQARFRVEGNAIVTGGAGDLGFAVCKALLEHGLAGLTVFDMNPAEAESKMNLLEAEFPAAKLRFVRVDVTDEETVGMAVTEAAEAMGSINILVNLVGMVACGHAMEWSAKDWNRVLNVNTIGGFLVARAVAPAMIQRKTGGSMIFIASMSAHRVNFPQPQAPYNVSKAGVVAMARSLAAEWGGFGIRVNSISPGYMDTILNDGDGLEEARKMWLARHPLGRMGQPDELTGVVVMLASRAGSYFNGSDLLMDGGQTLFL